MFIHCSSCEPDSHETDPQKLKLANLLWKQETINSAAPLTFLRPSSALRGNSPKSLTLTANQKRTEWDLAMLFVQELLAHFYPPWLGFILPSPHSHWEHSICQKIACGPTVQTLTVRSSQLNTSLGKQVRQADCNWLESVGETQVWREREPYFLHSC